MSNNKEIKKRLVFEISAEKHKEIKVVAAQLGYSMKDFIDEAIRFKIEKEKK